MPLSRRSKHQSCRLQRLDDQMWNCQEVSKFSRSLPDPGADADHDYAQHSIISALAALYSTTAVSQGAGKSHDPFQASPPL